MVLSGSEDLQSVLEPLYTTMECLISNFPSFLLKAATLSTDTVLSSNAFHKSTTLALKNFCHSVPFLFLNNLYLCTRVTLLGANSKNLSHCIDSFPVILKYNFLFRFRKSSLRNAADLYQMVARGLSEAKPLWRREGGRESQLRNACQRRSLSGCQREGVATKKRLSEAKPLWSEGAIAGEREGGERSERDGHRCKYRQHRRNLNTSPEARGLPQSEGHSRSYSLYSPLSMSLIFWPCLSVCFALYHIAVDQSKLCFFVSSLPAFLNF